MALGTTEHGRFDTAARTWLLSRCLCDPAREWLRKNRGLSAVELWERCENTEWLDCFTDYLWEHMPVQNDDLADALDVACKAVWRPGGTRRCVEDAELVRSHIPVALIIEALEIVTGVKS